MASPPSVLDRAARGDREALAELWRTHQAPLLRYLRARRMDSAEDVASAVWLDVGTSISRFAGDADDFRRWLFTIAHRRSVDEIRRAVRRPELLGMAVDAAATGGADTVYELQTSLDRAIELVRRLRPDMAEAVMLRVVNDLPGADVATIMGTSEGNVRVLVHRGLRTLRSKIAVTESGSSTMSLVS